MAAGNTYEAIATQTLGSAAASVTFSSISSSYTDLIFIFNPNGSIDNLNLQFNGDTGTNYSRTNLYGNGTSASSSRGSNASGIGLTISGDGETVRCNIMNYANATTYKTTIQRADASISADIYLGAMVGLWRSTAAVNSIKFYPNSGNIPAGAVLTLYGIKAA